MLLKKNKTNINYQIKQKTVWEHEQISISSENIFHHTPDKHFDTWTKAQSNMASLWMIISKSLL